MGVHALGLEARFSRQLPQDQERPGPRKRPALGVQEELRAVAAIEVRATSREVASERVDGLAADRDDAFLPALADRPNEPLVEVDAALVEADRLADTEAGAVEELDEGPVAEVARRRAGGGLDQPLRLGGRQRAWKAPGAARQLELRCRVRVCRSDQDEMAEER